MKKVGSEGDLERMTIVSVNDEKYDSNSSKKATNVGENLINFLKLSLIWSANSWLKKRKTTIDILSDLVRIFKRELCHYTPLILVSRCERQDAFISGYFILLHKQNSLCTQAFRKYYVVVIL